jgi:hypothetical protein
VPIAAGRQQSERGVHKRDEDAEHGPEADLCAVDAVDDPVEREVLVLGVVDALMARS